MQEYVFGDLLKTLRQTKHLSQQALADRLGVHRNTIWNWEQGVYLPDSRGMVLELARQLGLDEEETRQLLEASLTAVSSYWNVPFTRNPFFTGREQVLEQLQATLNQPASSAALTQFYALHGLGGIGKTQVAVEYAYQHRNKYEAVLWVEAETPITLISSFAALADLLALPERAEEKDQSKLVAAVLRWLNRHQGWLLIFDNVEDVAQLKPFLPASGQGAILLTTRLHTLGTLAQPVAVSPLTMEEGVAFLLARATHRPVHEADGCVDPHELTAARELVAVMGGLPLALDQAGAYMDATQCSLADYLHLFQSAQLRLLDAHDAASDHALSVSRTFALAFERLGQQNPAAAELLTVCAFLAPDTIPESFFLGGAVQLGPTFEALAADSLAFQDALRALLAYSLLQRDPAAHTLTIHRLVQVVLRERLAEGVQRTWTRRVMKAMSQLFPIDEMVQAQYWQAGELLLPHALAALAFSQRWEDEVLGLTLRGHVATYLCKRARYAEAKAHFERCLRKGEALLGSQHPLVAEALYGQAEVYREQGRYPEAESLYQRTLGIWEQQVASEHPQIARPLLGLADLYRDQGRFTEAEPLYQQGLSLWEQQWGPEHPHVAHPLLGLAHLYRDQGKYVEAEPLYQRALHIWEQALGPEHPRVAHPLNGLANLYDDQGKYTEAEPLYQRSLRIHEQALGADHPHVAAALNNLASLYHEQGKYAEAEPLYQRALHIWEQQLGPEHPRVAYPLNNIANLYYEQGKYARAEPLYQRARCILEQQLGLEHFHVAYPLHGLANLSREQGKYEQAALLYQRALAIYQSQLASNHPDLAECLDDFAHFHQVQQNHEEALLLYQQALTIRKQALGPRHSKTEQTRSAYARLLQEMGCEEEAARVLSAQGQQEQEH